MTRGAKQFETPKVLETPYWIAGVFEVAGSIQFTIKKQKYTYPVMTMGDNSLQRMTLMTGICGGTIHRNYQSNTWEWYLTGRRVAELALSMKDKAPSRKTALNAILDWASSPLCDRLAITSEFDSKQRDSVDPSAYQTNTTIPEFLAGIYDSRAIPRYFPSRQKPDATYPRLNIRSLNRALLLALFQQFGGSIYHDDFKGDIQDIDGQPSKIINDSYNWNLSGENLVKFLTVIRPCLKLRTIPIKPQR